MIIGVDLNQDKFEIGFRLNLFLSFTNKFILELYSLTSNNLFLELVSSIVNFFHQINRKIKLAPFKIDVIFNYSHVSNV
jgi:hypothetical protein